MIYVNNKCAAQRFWCSPGGIILVAEYAPNAVGEEVLSSHDDIMAALLIATYANDHNPPIRWQ